MNPHDNRSDDQMDRIPAKTSLPLVKGDVIEDENGRRISILSKVASGGFSRVYKACDEKGPSDDSHCYALKVPALIANAANSIVFEANVLEYVCFHYMLLSTL